jgi:hypothetical protein
VRGFVGGAGPFISHSTKSYTAIATTAIFCFAVCRECNSGGGGAENGFSLLLRLGGAREGVRDVGEAATGGGG